MFACHVSGRKVGNWILTLSQPFLSVRSNRKTAGLKHKVPDISQSLFGAILEKMKLNEPRNKKLVTNIEALTAGKAS